MTLHSKQLFGHPPSSRTSLTIALVALLLLRSRVLSIPKDILSKVKAVARGKPLDSETLAQVLEQVYVNREDGGKTLLVPVQDKYVAEVPIYPISPAKLAADKHHFPLLPLSARAKPNIDAALLRQLRAILFRIGFSKFRSKETVIVFAHTFFLVTRTVLSIAGARLDGRIVRDLVSANGKGFIQGLGLWFLLAIPSTYTNSMLRHFQSKLSHRLRTRLSRYILDLYLSSFPDLRYYRTGLEGVDQYITADVEAWAESLSNLYGNTLKPLLDLVLFTAKLSGSLGVRGTILLFANYYVTASILRAVTPAFGRLAAVEARLEGEYRAGMSRVGRDSEEIAFYDGGRREKDILTRAYMRLIKHVNSIYKIRIAYEWTEDFVIKYLWSAAGYGLIGVPLLLARTRTIGVQTEKKIEPGGTDDAIADRTESYISNRRLLLSLADAGGRIMYAYKDLLELAGLTTRLYTLLSTLHNLPPLSSGTSRADGAFELRHVDVGVPSAGLAMHQNNTESSEREGGSEGDSMPLPLPPPPPLVRDLSLVLKEGEHLMIAGSNGVGKTAVARVLAGIWAPQGGPLAEVRRPPAATAAASLSGSGGLRLRKSVYVVPQRAYMVEGSLMDQIIYPHSYTEFVETGTTEADLVRILEMVSLKYLPEREGGWLTRKEWRDVLSGGEKQRMAMARVFYHRPRYAILDECTSAVSSDVEGRMYEYAKALGITLITISIRPSLAKYHTQLLTLTGDGTGGWSLIRVGTAEERVGIDREIAMLEEKLAEVDSWERRVKELDELLGAQGTAHA